MKTVLFTMRSGWKLFGPALAVLAMPALALAAEGSADQGIPNLGMSPGEPQVRSATPSVPFGIKPSEAKENVLDFHGYILMPAHLGLHERETTMAGQSDTVLHSPPLMAQDLRDFEYTGVVPSPWLQLNFLYGNQSVYATAILAGTSAMDGSGYFNPVDQFGVHGGDRGGRGRGTAAGDRARDAEGRAARRRRARRQARADQPRRGAIGGDAHARRLPALRPATR